MTTAVGNKIKLVLECVTKDDNIRSSDCVILKTRRFEFNGPKRFYEETVRVRSSIIPDHIIILKERAFNYKPILGAISIY